MMDYEDIEVKDLPPSPMSSPTLVGIETGAFTKLGELEAELEGVKAELDASRQNAEDWHNRHSNVWNNISALETNLKNVLGELVAQGSIEKEHAKTIADKCGIEVTKVISFSGNISFSANVEVSIFDEDELDTYSLSASYLNLDYDGEPVSDLEYDIENVEEDYKY
jgi:hypothetical protein